MKKLLFTIAASAALLAVGPATALARTHHHPSHHRSHHVTIAHRHFGSDGPFSPSATTPPATTTEQNAGTVASFANGVLVIKLTDGTTMVSGQVTNATELECAAANPMSTFQDDRRGDGGGNGDQGNGGEDHGDRNEGEMTCSTTALTPGATVREADLRVSSAGAVWDKIELGS